MFELFLLIIGFVAGYFVHMKWPDLHTRLRDKFRSTTP